jgi:hypothetical protein
MAPLIAGHEPAEGHPDCIGDRHSSEPTHPQTRADRLEPGRLRRPHGLREQEDEGANIPLPPVESLLKPNFRLDVNPSLGSP